MILDEHAVVPLLWMRLVHFYRDRCMWLLIAQNSTEMTLPTTRADLVQAVQEGHSFDFHVFFGQNPFASTGADVESNFLSQAFPAPFVVDGKRYATAEHYMMAQKAYLFGDSVIGDRIVETNDPNEAKALGRQAQGFNAELWTAHRSTIVETGNRAKFSEPENAHLKALLLTTGSKVLVDATPTDKLWATGLSSESPDVVIPDKWPGLNLLGFALMSVRSSLAQE
ncbi:unnamed protein product [Aphanomyces euteiches]